MYVVVWISVSVQIAAGVLALRLIRVTQARVAWTFVAMGLWGMALRRLLALIEALGNGHGLVLGGIYEGIGLLTSFCMLAGVAMIGPMFREIRDSRDRANVWAEQNEKLAADLREALDNVKVLKGLLPICASCKRIRDDSGQWHSVESYIHTRTDADFSHGICPECISRLYPECDED
jgi:hypothetical protein